MGEMRNLRRTERGARQSRDTRKTAKGERGMKENELRKHSVCSRCGKKIGHTGLPLFWTVSATRYGIDFSALKRSAGLAMILGSAELAEVMGPNEDMAEQVQQ